MSDDNYDASDEVQENNLRRHQSRLEKEQVDFLRKSVLSTKSGRQWLYLLLTKCHIYSTPFDPNPHSMYFMLGEANVGNLLLQQAQRASPGLYVEMVTEAHQREEALKTIKSQDAVAMK